MTIDSPAPGSAEYLIQFLHPEKMLGLIPATGALDDMLAGPVVGVPADLAASLRGSFAANALAHARRLLTDDAALLPELARLGAVLSHATLAAVGDSITDDLQSWAHILDHLVGKDLGGPGWTVLNFGRSADTTADLLCRFAQVLATEPDVIAVQIGSNDAKLFAHSPGGSLVSPAETTRNARLLDRAARTAGARVVWVLPPTPDFARLSVCPWFVEAGLGWEPAVFTATRAAIRDVVEVFVDPDDLLVEATDLLEDGLHPSAWGQAKICRAVVAALAETEPQTEPQTMETGP
jgi:acyl-CoA thioesterase I